ncbi:MAG TPA: PAS domain S-box protein, partial [Pyrinomonadaceae bacterium]|nr:PAS domain S-box protein [Pyrinomonadaceae bacterium]
MNPGRKTTTGHDLAERLKQAEEALHARELNFQLMVDSIPAQVAVISPTGEVERLNQPCLEYFGKTLEELKGWASSDPVHAEDLPHVSEVLKHALETGETYEVESRHRRFDGVYRWFHVRGFPLKDADGRILRWCVLLTDIDDRKRNELLLRESELHFKTVFDEAGAGIALLDLNGGAPVRNNRALQKMLDCTEEELGRLETFDRLTHEDEREKDATTFRELCAGQRDSLRLEKRFVLRDGRSIWANVIFTLLRDDQGDPRYVIAIHEDITERKRVLETLQAQQDLLDLAQKAARAMAFDWYIQEDVNAWSPEQ